MTGGHPDEPAALWEVASPDGRLAVTISLGASGRALFGVALGGEALFESCPLGLSTSAADFTDGLALRGERRRAVDERYEMISGKTSCAVGRANELTLSLAKGGHPFEIVFRAYDDGVAFRYALGGSGTLRIYAERSVWRLAGGAPWRSWCQRLVRNYEGFYLPQQGLPTGEINFPALLRRPGLAWALLTEAAVYGDSCGSHLLHDPAHPEGALRVVAADDQANPPAAPRPHATPWRVAVIGTDLARLVESNLVESLSPPCELEDLSWIRPGRVYWSWWAGAPQGDLGEHLRHLGAGARLGAQYYLADAGWRREWLPDLVEAAAAMGVGVLVWHHHRDMLSEDDMEARLGELAALGVRGVKVDFFDSDSQERIALYDALARSTARHRLLLNCHGATKPAGERRRWPHLLTREGVYGAEYHRIGIGPTAEHDCSLPFTRNAIGPMDFTPLAFSGCRGQTTIGHQLALPVVFESGLQHLSDPPEALDAYGPGIGLITACPAAWDETRLVDGYPGDLAVIARRRGGEWFVGAISAADEERSLALPLGFLGGGRHEAVIYEDVKDAKDVDGVADRHEGADADGTLRLRLAPWGGAAVRIASV